jgi:protein-disulfide isomerase
MRTFAVLAAALALIACQPSAHSGVAADDMAMGNAAAKVTVIEYASVACPHCARFNNEVFPGFKAKYVDTGKVLWVEREALTGDPAVAAAGFLTARCAGKSKYFQVVDAIYHAQAQIFANGQPHAVLLNIARSAGLTDAQFEACIRDEKAIADLNSRWQRYIDEDKIRGTPTFVVNGKVYDKGEMSLTDIETAVSKAGASPS